MSRGADFWLGLRFSLVVFWPWHRCGFVYSEGGSSAWAAPAAPGSQHGGFLAKGVCVLITSPFLSTNRISSWPIVLGPLLGIRAGQGPRHL